MRTTRWFSRHPFILSALGILIVALCLTGWAPVPIDGYADATFLGQTGPAHDKAGERVAMVGDVNGDGYDDFLVAAPLGGEPGAQVGKVYLLLGKPDAGWGADYDLSDADASFLGEKQLQHTGEGMAGAGDVNADGYADFLIGADKHSPDETSLYNGKTYLILGRPAADWGQDYPLANADASFVGEAAYDQAGSALDNAGDVNGDGYDDFLVGAFGHGAGNTYKGIAYLMLGRSDPASWGRDGSLADSADALFVGEATFDYAGSAVAGAGDVDGDGYDDFLVGAYSSSESANDAGQVYLILGRQAADWGPAFSLSQADASFLGEAESDGAGCSLAGVGDLDCDGLDDFAIGAEDNDQGSSNAGKVYLLLGRSAADWGTDFDLANADASFVGDDTEDHAGSALSPAGDVNRDGFDDWLIAANGYDVSPSLTDAGRVYMVLGRPGGWVLNVDLADVDEAHDIMAFDGEAAEDRLGTGLAGGGDVNGDGFEDFLLGAPDNDQAGSNAGKAYLALGKGLALQKGSSSQHVVAGEAITYTLCYSNTNTWEVPGVRIIDPLPQQMEYLGCSGGQNCIQQDERVIWYLGAVPAQSSGTVTLTTQALSGLPVGTEIRNTAYITAPSRINSVSSTYTVDVWEGPTMLYLPLVPKEFDGTYEVAYDDGTEDEDTSQDAGKGYAVCFTVHHGYTHTKLTSARFYFSAPLAPIEVHVWDTDRNDLITPFIATPTQEGWFDVDLSAEDLLTTEHDFYVGYIYQSDDAPILGVDTSDPDTRSFLVDGDSWLLSAVEDYMIRIRYRP